MGLLTGELRSISFGLVVLPAVTSRLYVTWSLAEMGSFAEGVSVGEEAMRLAEEAEQPFGIGSALMAVGLLSRRQGALHTAIPILERGLKLCQSANIPFYFPAIAASLGAAYALAGRVAEALPLLDQMLGHGAIGSLTPYRPLLHTELSEALLLVGRVDEASTFAERLHDLSRTHTGHGYQAHAHRLLGDIATCHDPPDLAQAEAHYQQALALAEELGMRPLQAHCHLSLGTLYVKTGQREQARAALSTAVDLYRAMEMTFWLPQAEAALAQVE
jgi:tetratricopeptide (TPR) repeat protein